MVGKKLQGQVAIITGASRGIGAATAAVLGKAGASLVLVARDDLLLESVAQELRGQGCRVEVAAADVSDPESLELVMDVTMEHFRRVDILVNNAGVIWPIDEVVDADLDEWAYNIHVNLVGPFYLARTVLPLMLHQNYGRILNVSSGAAQQPIPGASAYCAAKAGLDMFTRTLALELKESQVTANTLYPGMVDTDMQGDIRSVDTHETALDYRFFHETFEQGLLRPSDQVAQLIYWLVGPWSRGHNGELYDVADAAWVAQVASDLGLPA